MSLILEALRKSEAERQIGRPPGLLSPTGPAMPGRRPRSPLPAGLAAVVLIAGGAWWLGTRSTAPTGPLPTTTAGSGEAPAPAQSAADLPASPGTPTQPPVPSPTGQAAAGPGPAVQLPAAPATTQHVDPPPPAASTPASPAVEPPAAGVAAPAARTGAPTIPYASLELMPASERAALPSLKLSVHVYADEPERRFAIVDGRRRAEGDVIQDGLSVEAILPDGVLLKVGQRTWLLPRP